MEIGSKRVKTKEIAMWEILDWLLPTLKMEGCSGDVKDVNGRRENKRLRHHSWSQEDDKEYRWLLEFRKGKKSDSPLGPPEGKQPWQHLDFSPVTPILDFWPPKL